MRILVVFGTTEGHTREISQFAARCLREAGHKVAVEEATPKAGGAKITAYDAIILAGSVHVGRFQAGLLEFARQHKEAIARVPSAFITVSLAAAGENPHDWAGLEQCVARFEQEAGWTPRALHHAAGAIRYSRYDFFKRLAIQHIAAKRGRKTVTAHDYDLTDYDALKAFLLQFAQTAAASPRLTQGDRRARSL